MANAAPTMIRNIPAMTSRRCVLDIAPCFTVRPKSSMRLTFQPGESRDWAARLLSSVDLVVLHDLAPLGDLTLDEAAEYFGARQSEGEALLSEQSLDGGIVEGLQHVLAHALDDGWRRARGSEQAPPRLGVVTRYRHLGDGRRVGELSGTFCRGYGQGDQLAGLDMRGQQGHRGNGDRHVPSNGVHGQRTAA